MTRERADAVVPLPKPTVKVLYLVSTGRSGSTLIGQVLGQFERVAYIGELGHVWGSSWGSPGGRRFGAFGLSPRTCGCGLSVTECPTWQEALRRLANDLNLRCLHDLGPLVLEQRRSALKWPRGLRALTRQHWKRAGDDELAYARTITRLYQHVADVLGVEMVVDSSKERADYVAMTAVMSGGLADAGVLHLVRDPRATVHAWLHRFRTVGMGPMPTPSFAKAVRMWIAANIQAEAVARVAPTRARLRYETFTEAPEATTRWLAEVFGLEGPNPVQGNVARLAISHHCDGNPRSRFASDAVTIGAEGSWRASRNSAQSSLTWLVAAPLARRYGYRR